MWDCFFVCFAAFDEVGGAASDLGGQWNRIKLCQAVADRPRRSLAPVCNASPSCCIRPSCSPWSARRWQAASSERWRGLCGQPSRASPLLWAQPPWPRSQVRRLTGATCYLLGGLLWGLLLVASCSAPLLSTCCLGSLAMPGCVLIPAASSSQAPVIRETVSVGARMARAAQATIAGAAALLLATCLVSCKI